jgi:hypothetical protein
LAILGYTPKGEHPLHPDVCRVWVITGEATWQTWKDAVNTIGSAMQSFRAQQQDRNRTNAIFGLPINHAPDDIKRLTTRRASPLWLRVTKLGSGSFVGIATLFKSEFTSGTPEVGGSYALIESFIQQFPTCLEVTYR